MSEAAPAFFRIVQDTFWEDVLLHVARLTDSPKSANRSNLSFRHLAKCVQDAETKAKVECLASNALLASEFCRDWRDWRNRRIAHRDLRLALEQDADPLKPASREKVREAPQALVAALNVVSEHYLGSTTSFEHGTDAQSHSGKSNSSPLALIPTFSSQSGPSMPVSFPLHLRLAIALPPRSTTTPSFDKVSPFGPHLPMPL